MPTYGILDRGKVYWVARPDGVIKIKTPAPEEGQFDYDPVNSLEVLDLIQELESTIESLREKGKLLVTVNDERFNALLAANREIESLKAGKRTAERRADTVSALTREYVQDRLCGYDALASHDWESLVAWHEDAGETFTENVLTKLSEMSAELDDSSDRLAVLEEREAKFNADMARVESRAIEAEEKLAEAQRLARTGEVGFLNEKLAASEARVGELEIVSCASEELLEVARLRGDNELPHPSNDALLWTARMQQAWEVLEAALEPTPASGEEGE